MRLKNKIPASQTFGLVRREMDKGNERKIETRQGQTLRSVGQTVRLLRRASKRRKLQMVGGLLSRCRAPQIRLLGYLEGQNWRTKDHQKLRQGSAIREC